MISIQSPEVKDRIAGWQSELRAITGDDTVKLIPASHPEINLSLEEIVEVVVYATSVEYNKLCSRNRTRGITLARHLVCWFGYKRHHISWRDIGEYLGGRDHSSAMHGRDCIKNLLDIHDPATVQYVEKIGQYLEELKKRIATINKTD